MGGQGHLGRLAPGDVDQRVVRAQKAALLVQHCGGVEQADEAGPVAPQHADLGRLQRFAAFEALQALQHFVEVRRLHVVAEVFFAHHLAAALVTQPGEFGLVDQHIQAVGVHRVVTAGRLVVGDLGLAQRALDPVLGFGQLFGALLDRAFQLGVEALDAFLLQVLFRDVARDRQQHHRLAVGVADRRHHGVPPLGRSLERGAISHKAGALTAPGGRYRTHGQLHAIVGPPVGPGAQAHLFEVVHLHQAATLCRHLHHAPFQIQHLGAVRAAGNDLAVEFVLDARFGLERAHGRDVLDEAELARDIAVLVAQRRVARQHMHDLVARPDQPELNAQTLAGGDAADPVLLHAGQVVGVHTVEPAEVGEFTFVESEDLLQPGVDVGEQAGLVGAKDADGKRAAQRSKQRLVLQLRGGHRRTLVGIQRQFERQRQLGMKTRFAGRAFVQAAAHVLGVAAPQVQVFGLEGLDLQQQRPFASRDRCLGSVGFKTAVFRREESAHRSTVPHRAPC